MYQPQRRLVRVVGTAFLLYAFGVPFLLSAGSMLYQGVFPERPAAVTIENQTGVPFISWGNTEPVPRPTGDYFSARFGFAIGPHAVVVLPDNRTWDSVEIYTLACKLVAEEILDGPSRIVIAPEGTVTIERGEPADSVEPASPTDECPLVPYMPFTVPPL